MSLLTPAVDFPPFDYVALGNNIVKQRLACKMTQNRLAERAGVDRKTVGFLEAAESLSVRLENVYRIACALGCRLDDLLPAPLPASVRSDLRESAMRSRRWVRPKKLATSEK